MAATPWGGFETRPYESVGVNTTPFAPHPFLPSASIFSRMR